MVRASVGAIIATFDHPAVCPTRLSGPLLARAPTLTVWPTPSQTFFGTAIALPVVIGAFFLSVRLALDSGVLGAGRALSTFEVVVGLVAAVVTLPALPTLSEFADAFPAPWGVAAGALPGALIWGWLGSFVLNAVRARRAG